MDLNCKYLNRVQMLCWNKIIAQQQINILVQTKSNSIEGEPEYALPKSDPDGQKSYYQAQTNFSTN